jgi:hypothetical protein
LGSNGSITRRSKSVKVVSDHADAESEFSGMGKPPVGKRPFSPRRQLPAIAWRISVLQHDPWHRRRRIGAHGRLGNVGDGNIVQEVLGIPTVQYGPGDIRIYKEWPTADERVRLTDLVTAAKAVAHATVSLCS